MLLIKSSTIDNKTVQVKVLIEKKKEKKSSKKLK